MNYKLNIQRILFELLPWFFKKQDNSFNWSFNNQNWSTLQGDIWAFNGNDNKLISFLTSILSALVKTNILFETFAKRQKYLSSFNGQVMYLERLLNDLFDPFYKRIYIVDANLLLPPTLFFVSEIEPPIYVFKSFDNHTPIFYLYKDIDYYTFPNFIVKVPLTILNTKQKAIERWLNIYKLAATKYMLMGFDNIPPDAPNPVIDNSN